MVGEDINKKATQRSDEKAKATEASNGNENEKPKRDVKKVPWIYDKVSKTVKVGEGSNKAESEKKFSFKLKRFKNKETHEEHIEITCLLLGKPNGTITTSILSLENDIRQFKRFGVVIGDTYFRDICKCIKNEYIDLKVNAYGIDEKNDELNVFDGRLEGLIEYVKEFLSQCKDFIGEDLCYVPVNIFNDLATDCGFYSYEMGALRSYLASMEYINTRPGRHSILVRIKDKPERVIAFKRNMLGISPPERKEDRSGKKGGANEQ